MIKRFINFNNLFKIKEIKFPQKNCNAYFSVRKCNEVPDVFLTNFLRLHSKTKYQNMRKGVRFSAVSFAAFIFSLTTAFAQSITITGNVKHATTSEGVG